MNCPNCITESLSETYNGNQGYGCSQCEGVWFAGANLIVVSVNHELDIGLLRALLKQDKKSDGPRNCPECGKQLAVSTVNKIELDWCVSCDGMWFDRDEFNRVVSNSKKETKVQKFFGVVDLVHFFAVVIRGLR